MDRQHKPRNYLKNVTFTLLNTNRGNWTWFRLENILNNIDMKKASWVNHVISLNRQYKPRNYLKNVTLIVSYHVISLNRQQKPRNYLKNVTFTLLNTNRGNWKWFRLETILINNKIKKHRDLTIEQARIDNTRLETILNMLHLTYFTWAEVTESDSG